MRIAWRVAGSVVAAVTAATLLGGSWADSPRRDADRDADRDEVRREVVRKEPRPEIVKKQRVVVRTGGAFLGVHVGDSDEDGIEIAEVVPDSPADEAGLRAGDVIVEFDGIEVRGPMALTELIHAREAGDQVSIRVLRDGRERELEAELGDRSDAEIEVFVPEIEFDAEEMEEWSRHWAEQGEKWKEWGEKWQEWGEKFSEEHPELRELPYGVHVLPNVWHSRPRLGVQLVETTPELRRHLGGEEDAGVLVSKVIEDTPADDAGIEVGDLILSIDGDEVSSTGDLREALAERAGERVRIEVVRDGRRVTVEATLEEPDEEMPSGPRARLAPLPRMRTLMPPPPPHVEGIHVVPLPMAPDAPDAPDAPAPQATPAPPGRLAPLAPMPPEPRIPRAPRAPLPGARPLAV